MQPGCRLEAGDHPGYRGGLGSVHSFRMPGSDCLEHGAQSGSEDGLPGPVVPRIRVRIRDQPKRVRGQLGAVRRTGLGEEPFDVFLDGPLCPPILALEPSLD